MNTINPQITEEQLMAMINNVHKNVDDIYKKSHSKTQYLTYSVGKGMSRVFKFMRSPQIKVMNIILFWAVFVASWVMAALAYSTVSAFILFGLIIAAYTDLSATAVYAIIKNTMYEYFTGALKNV